MEGIWRVAIGETDGAKRRRSRGVRLDLTTWDLSVSEGSLHASSLEICRNPAMLCDTLVFQFSIESLSHERVWEHFSTSRTKQATSKAKLWGSLKVCTVCGRSMVCWAVTGRAATGLVATVLGGLGGAVLPLWPPVITCILYGNSRSNPRLLVRLFEISELKALCGS